MISVTSIIVDELSNSAEERPAVVSILYSALSPLPYLPLKLLFTPVLDKALGIATPNDNPKFT